MKTMRSLSKTVTQQDSDASRHTLICGTSSTGISVYLNYLMHQDIAKGKKIVLIDPWGDLVKQASATMSDKALLIDLSNESAHGLCSIFHTTSTQEYDTVAQNVIDLFVHIYDPDHRGVIGPRFEFAARNIILALLYAGIPSFENMHKAMIDPTFIQSLLPHVPEGPVRQYWSAQMAQTSDFHRSEILDYVVSKFGIFMQKGPIKTIFESSSNTRHDLISLMHTKQVVLIDTSVVRTSTAIATVVYMALGATIRELTKTSQDPKSIYIDEVNMFAGSESLVQAFDEGHRSHTEFTVVSRDLESMQASLRSKILRFGTLVAFRQAVKDGQVLAEHFLDPTVTAHTLATQKKYAFSLRYLDGGEIKVSTDNTIDLSS